MKYIVSNDDSTIYKYILGELQIANNDWFVMTTINAEQSNIPASERRQSFGS